MEEKPFDGRLGGAEGRTPIQSLRAALREIERLRSELTQANEALRELLAEADAPVGWVGHNGRTAGFEMAHNAIAMAEDKR